MKAHTGILLMLLANMAPSVSCALPDRFSAEYLVQSQGSTVGESRWELAADKNGLYVYEKHSKTAGLLSLFRNQTVTERSEWRYRNGEMQPHAYRYKRFGREKNRDVKISFDWEKRTVRTTVNGDPWQMTLPDGTLDKLIYSLAMMRDLAQGERNLEYTVADGGTLKTYQIEPVGEETIETALGRMHTVKVRRFRNKNKRQTILWCAPAFSFLPVRMEHREKDGTLVFLIQSAEGFDESEAAAGR